jgi:hypothetical protein
MPFKKGIITNANGRGKGTLNKVTKEIKEIIKDVLEKEFEIIDSTLKELEPEKRLEIVLKLLPYVVPKLNNTQYDVTGNNVNTPTIIFKKFNEVELTKEQKDKLIDRL